MAPARRQCMSLELQKYNLTFVYKKETELYVVDTLSRAYLNEKPGAEGDDQFHVLAFTEISPTRMSELKEHTLTAPVMQKVAIFITHGWPARLNTTPRCTTVFSSKK